MKYIITESQLRLLTEQSIDSSVSCDKNNSKTSGHETVWKNMDPNKRNELIKELNSVVSSSLDKSREEYMKWFQNPLTIKKFKTPKEQEVLKRLPAFIQTIKKINYAFSGPKNGNPNSRAWVSPKDLTLINYNLSQLHDGRDFYGMSIDDTTKHEMGHLIDYFFQKNGLKPYIQTIETDTQELYNANYIVNDRDQYTRLNVLRGIIDAGPSDSPQILLSKFLSKVKSGKINSNKFNFSGVSSKTGMSQKNDTEKATEIFGLLKNSIFVDGKNNHNIEQIFSNYGINKGGTIYVSFDMLAEQNETSYLPESTIFISEQSENQFFFLKMSPK